MAPDIRRALVSYPALVGQLGLLEPDPPLFACRSRSEVSYSPWSTPSGGPWSSLGHDFEQDNRCSSSALSVVSRFPSPPPLHPLPCPVAQRGVGGGHAEVQAASCASELPGLRTPRTLLGLSPCGDVQRADTAALHRATRRPCQRRGGRGARARAHMRAAARVMRLRVEDALRERLTRKGPCARRQRMGV